VDLRDRIISTLAGALVLASGAARPADVHGATALTGDAAVLEWNDRAAPLTVGPAGAARIPALKPVPVLDAGRAPDAPAACRIGASPVRVSSFFEALARAWGDALNSMISQG